ANPPPLRQPSAKLEVHFKPEPQCPGTGDEVPDTVRRGTVRVGRLALLRKGVHAIAVAEALLGTDVVVALRCVRVVAVSHGRATGDGRRQLDRAVRLQ